MGKSRFQALKNIGDHGEKGGIEAGFWGPNGPYFFIFALRALISLNFFPP